MNVSSDAYCFYKNELYLRISDTQIIRRTIRIGIRLVIHLNEQLGFASIGIARPGYSMSDPGEAATPNTSRGVPTVMGPDRSAVNTAFSTPTPSHEQLQLSAIASTKPYVPARQLNDTAQDHLGSSAGNAAASSMSYPQSESSITDLVRSDLPSADLLSFGTVRPEDYQRVGQDVPRPEASAQSPLDNRSAVTVNFENLERLTPDELETFMTMCQQRYQELKPDTQPPFFSRQSVEMAAELVMDEIRQETPHPGARTFVPNFRSAAPPMPPQFQVPTVEEILSSPDWFTPEEWTALTDRDRTIYWNRAFAYRERIRTESLSEAMHRVYNPAHTKSPADKAHQELFAKRGREDLPYMTAPQSLPYLQKRRQDFAEAKMTAEGQFVPLAGTGNANNALDGGFVRGDTYAPTAVFRDRIATPPQGFNENQVRCPSTSPAAYPPMQHPVHTPVDRSMSAVHAKVRNVFRKTKNSAADSVVGKYKGTPAFWSTVDPREAAFDHVHLIQMTINWVQMKGAFEYICAALIGKLVLRDEPPQDGTKNEIREFITENQVRVTVHNELSGMDNVSDQEGPALSGHARRLVRQVLQLTEAALKGKKILKAPTLFAEALHRFEQENDKINFIADAETAAEIDARLKAAQWEQSSLVVRESLFGPAAEVTFLEVFVRMLNDPFSSYKALHHVEALEAEIRLQKPAGMTNELFHRQFRQKLEQYRYANNNVPMFPTAQKAMACLVRCYSNYPKVSTVLSTFETVCSVQGTLAPWLPDSTSEWKLENLMKYIEEHSELNGNVNPLLPKQTASAKQEEKSVNALTSLMEQFKRFQSSKPGTSASQKADTSATGKHQEKGSSEKGLQALAARITEKWKSKSDANGKCKRCHKKMPPAGPDAGGPNDCMKCKKCMKSCLHSEDNCPYDSSNSKSFKKFQDGEKEYEWPKGWNCPKCRDKHPGKEPIQCTGQQYMAHVQRQKDILAGKEPSDLRGQMKSVNAVATEDFSDEQLWKKFQEFAETSTTDKNVKFAGALVSTSAVKVLCSVASNRTDLVLVDHGAEVSIHGHPKHSVGLLTVDPSVSLQGPLGDTITEQQGHCKQRYDTQDQDGRIVSLDVPKSYYCPGVARCSIAAGCDLRKAGWSFHDSSSDVLVQIADQLHHVSANVPTLINLQGIQVPLKKIPGSDLLWVQLIEGDSAPVMSNPMGVVPASPKIPQTVTHLQVLAKAVCALVTDNFENTEKCQALLCESGPAITDAEHAYYLHLSTQGCAIEATGTNLERDAKVPTIEIERTDARKKMIATLRQKCDADLAKTPDVEVVRDAAELLPFCCSYLSALSGFEPALWLEHLVSTESKAYLLRVAITALRQSESQQLSNTEAAESLSRFRNACAHVSAEAANILQLMNADSFAKQIAVNKSED